MSITISQGKILKNRIKKKYTTNAVEEAGFRAGRSRIDHHFTLTHQRLIRRFSKIVKNIVNIKIIKAVKSLYQNTRNRIKVKLNMTARK